MLDGGWTDEEWEAMLIRDGYTDLDNLTANGDWYCINGHRNYKRAGVAWLDYMNAYWMYELKTGRTIGFEDNPDVAEQRAKEEGYLIELWN